MVGAYVRVSSRSQDLATQRNAIERTARARGDRVRRWYSEKLSAAKLCRPALDSLRADARAGRIKRLYVYRLDRLSRSGIRETLTLVNELQQHGVDVQTIADGFAFGGPAGDVVLAVLAWAAQMERLAIGERIAAARVRVVAAGGSWGRPRRVDTAGAARVRKLSREGLSNRKIAIALKIPRATVGNVLAKKGAYKAPPAKPTKKGGSVSRPRAAK